MRETNQHTGQTDTRQKENTHGNARFSWTSLGLSRSVVALSVARMSDALGNSILIIIIPLYVAKLPSHWLNFQTPVLIGILISVYGFINFSVQPLMGALSDRIGRRKLLIQIGLGLMCLATAGYIIAAQYVDLLVLRIIQGIGIGITVPAAMALMAGFTERSTRGGSMGFYTTLRMLGFSIGPLLGGFLLVHFGFGVVFIVGAGFLLLAITLIHLWVKDLPVEQDPSRKSRFRIVDKSLLTPGILTAALSTFVMANAFALITSLENEFNSKLGLNAFGFAFAFSTMMFGRLLFQVPLGRLSDRIGRKPLILAGLLLMVPTTAFLGRSATNLEFILLRGGQGIAAAAIAAPAFAIAGDLSTKEGAGRQMSIVTMGFGLGIATGPLMSGLLSVVSFDLPFLVSGLMCLIGAWFVFRHMPETVRGDAVEFKSDIET